jgi:para-nitrobenzyl esterase
MTSPANTRPAPRVALDIGTIEGADDGAVESFKGIRFAAPPTGDWRWRAPRPAQPWTGVQQTTRFGADCMQTPFAEDMAPLTTQPAEDCLFLNAWRPAGAGAGASLPVVVWIYGGGFVNGGASPAVYHGESFAKNGVVFVSFNYRIGHFGYFAFPELTRLDADHGLLGNYGHMDQLEALRWIQRNIAAFGGNPNNITVIGESAGGASVVALMTSPLAAGLLHKAIVMSGGGRGLLDGNRLVSEDTARIASGETLGSRLARRHDIGGDGRAALSALRALPAEALAQRLSIPTLERSRDVFSGQMLDGRIIVDASAALTSGQWAKVPVITGTTVNEVGNLAAATKQDAWAHFGPDASAAEAAYDTNRRSSLAEINANIGMDRKMHEPARFLAGVVGGQGLPAYLYRFSYVASSARERWQDGAPHASDIPYFLGRLSAPYGRSADEQDRDVARIAHQYVVNFARHGDPNGAGLPRWEVFAQNSGRLFDFAADGRPRMGADPLKARLDLATRRAEQA